MANKFISKLTFCAFSLLTFSGFAQDSTSTKVKDVDVLVIGKKQQNVSEPVKPKPTAAVFPGSIEVVDMRDQAVFRIIPADDDVIAARIKTIENEMPMPYNEHVKKYIDYFLYKRPSFVKQMLERKEFYFPIFEKYLAKYNMPPEMKYLALLESGLDPNAVSRAKAVGLWQFMSYTGKEYGLHINDYMDERRHLEKATDASFRYLTNLHKMFDDWELALASYNTGPGRIRRAIRKSGHSDYWTLHRYIHPDTRAYVPQWEALNYLMNYSAEHGIFPDYAKTLAPIETENVKLDGPLNLAAFASLNYLDYNTLKLLNPHLLKDELPAHARQVDMQIPKTTFQYFSQNRKCVLDSAMILSSADPETYLAQTDAKGEYHIEYKETKAYHQVRSGDYLGKLAERYNVSVSDLKRWNNLKSTNIMRGQRLVYYKNTATRVYDRIASEPKVETKLASNTNVSNADKSNGEARSNVKIASSSGSKPLKTEEEAEPEYKIENKLVAKYHQVRSGDNLTEIANRYGVSISQIKDWNDLSSNKILRGQKLKYFTTVSQKTYAKADAPNSSDKKDIIIHTVQRGDTLWNISQKYGYSVAEIKRLNGLSGNTVKVGQKLRLKS